MDKLKNNQLSVAYIGILPPPFGGVTLKNRLIFECIFKDVGAEFINVMEAKTSLLKAPLIICKIIYGMFFAQSVVIGTGARWCDKFLFRLQRILTGRRGLRKIMMIIMGGRYHEFVAKDRELYRLLLGVGSIWVESEQMIKAFKNLGLEQTYLFPNCRTNDGERIPRNCHQDEKLRLVFFSRICLEKGVESIIDAYYFLDEDAEKVTLDFYGDIEDDIQDKFRLFISKNKNVVYHGVFDAVNEDVYAELNQYDVMLLMSKREGVAGALVESKMAGITAIVSDRGCNPETVRNDVEGIVLSYPFAENLANAIKKLLYDRNKLQSLKEGAFESRKRYCIDTYRQIMIDHALK